MSEQVEGGDDGVVYLGRSGFKMKVGVKTTPPAGTPAALGLAPTLAPSQNTLAPVRRSSGSFRRRPAVVEETAPLGARTRTMVVGGLCMIAFSCGVMCTIAVDRFWPHARPQCDVAEPASTETVPSAAETPGIEAARVPAAGVVVTPLPPADPIQVEQAAAALPLPAPAVAPAPQAPAPRAARSAGPARVPPGQGRAAARKHAAGAPRSLDTMSPTGMWIDPFAQ